MPFKFSNAATATLASSITSSSTTLSVAAGLGALFPSMAAGEFFAGVLVDSSNNVEIVRVTARTGDVMTVTRAQEGTTARAYSAGSRFEVRLTSAGLSNFLQLDGAQTVTGQKTFTQTIIGNLQGNVTGNASTATLATTATTASNALACSGNSATVTNGVYTVGDQSIGGVKTFTGFLQTTQARMAVVNAGSAMYEMHIPGVAGRGLYVSTDGVTRLSTTNGSGTASDALWSSDASGNFTALGNVTAYSDERLKTNWRALDTHFLSDLADVKVGIYERKDTGETQVGVSAQSLQAILPQAVREGTDGMLSVAYGNAALAACVMLAREVAEIKQKLEA